MAKKPNGEGSIFQLPNGKWKASVSMGVGVDGKRRRQSKTARSRADAAAFLREMQVEIYSGSGIEPSRMTLADYLTWWLKEVVLPDRSENTYESYRRSIENHIIPAIGQILLGKMQPIHVQHLLSAMVAKGTGDRTRQIAHGTLQTAMSHAKSLKMIRENPCCAVRRPRGTRKKIRPFTVEETRKLIEQSIDHRLHALIVLEATTGLRQAELFGLHWEHFDLEAGKVRVEQQAVEIAGHTIVRKPKTAGSVRTVELTDMAIDAMKRHRATMLREGNAGNPIVFCGRRGGYIGRGNFRIRVWKPLLLATGIEYRGFHHLRHTFATLALGAGVPLHVVSSVLGHTSSATTLRAYAHVLGQQNTAATATIGRLFA